ncbi:MAG: hypothetical protein IJJ78_05985 [Paludibacteraceae bacterium]|nr:hypothetical protein [Paludibacteraceae bacterium]
MHHGSTYKIYYLCTDHLGSITLLMNDAGNTVERHAYDAWGRKRNVNDWSDYNVENGKLDRGYTGHESLREFGLINMNGRMYDPILGRMLSPDNYVQDPFDLQNYNRYTYCLNNPLKYTDPSGEFLWLIPNIGWSKEGGLSIGISVVVGIPGGLSAQAGIGYNFGSNDAYGYVGATAAMNTVYASYSLNSGGSVGYTAGLSLFSGFPISSNFGTVGVNYNISHDSWSGNVSAWQFDQNGVTFNPSVSVMIFPERTTNLVRGKGFNNNNTVLNRFVEAGDYQGALDYFGFEGRYDPNNPLFNNNICASAITDPKTGEIFFCNGAFCYGYDRLAFYADHESIHSQNVLSGKYKGIKVDYEIAWKEEWSTYMRNYHRQGLYHKHEVNIIDRINSYGMFASIYDYGETSTGFHITQFNKQWWHFIYRIPRRW